MISLVITLIVIGLLLYLVETLLPISPDIKRIIHVVIIICVILWLVSIFLGGGPGLDLRLR